MAEMRIEGSFAALITPLNAHGPVDFGAFRTLLDWHARNGTPIEIARRLGIDHP